MRLALTLMPLLFVPLLASASDEPAADAAEVQPTQAETPDPFGFDLGGDFAPYADQCKAVESDIYKCGTAPTPLGGVESYMMVVNGGKIAKVVALGSQMTNDRYGTKVRARFDELKDMLTKKYGKPSNDFDFLRASGLWDDPGDFAMALRTGERTLVAYWKVGDTTISLDAKAASQSDTYVWLSYEHTPTFKSFSESKDQADANAL